VGYDGSTYGAHPHIAQLLTLPNVRATVFCPENFSFGTPRALCDIQGGDGHDVLAGRARVLTADGNDWTSDMVRAAQEMLRIAKESDIQLAILMDISAACGSQVIYSGGRPHAPYRIGRGVCAALLAENGIAVVSQRDFRTLSLIFAKVGSEFEFGASPKDHHETEWYVSYFKHAAGRELPIG
jgi:uncharacterized protein YbbK (DUF523 family)